MLRFPSSFLIQLVWTFGTFRAFTLAAMLAERVTIPAPIVVEPSQTFDGNDGPFSSFNISVGTPPQDLKVFVSTSLYQTLVVVPGGCGATPANCTALRGGEFILDSSSTWQNNTANVSSNVYFMLVDTQLGYDGKAELGFDVVSLAGSPETTLQNQTVGGFAVTYTYLGLFGIDPRSSTFKTSNGSTPPIPSYLQNLRNQSLIPSLSWGYTAGNQYRFDKVFGSLTLGGYDKSRFTQHDGSWPIDDEDNLSVELQYITETSGSENPQGLLPTPITAVIDSSLPYIWLPIEAYTEFEIAFGLEWDDAAQLYLLNDTQHKTLLQRNSSLTFTLNGMQGGSTNSVNITLPYAALDLTASSPLVDNATRYYPLKRAANPNQFVIGRTFLQEAYVIADFERRNFSVFPCQWDANAIPNIASTFSPAYNKTSSNTNQNSGGGSKGSSHTGPIVGGVIGGLVFLAAAFALAYFCWWRPKRRQHYTTDGKLEKPEIATSSPENPSFANVSHADKAELANTQRHELEGSAGPSTAGPSTAGPSYPGPAVFEMSAREEVASELRATNTNAHELLTPDTTFETPQEEFPWESRLQAGRANSPSPQSPGSRRIESMASPVSSPSPGLPSPLPSPSMIPSSVPSPLPSPPPVVQPQPRKVVRPGLFSVNSS